MDELLEIRKGLAQIQHQLYELDDRVARLSNEHATLQLIINGDPTRDVEGLRTRIKVVEASVEEWARYKLLVKGMAIGVGLTMVTSVANLITIVTQLAGKVP